VDKVIQELEYHNDPVQQFVEDRCEPSTVLTKGSELFKTFREFCDQNNCRRLSNQEFYHKLEEKYDSSPLDHQKAFYLRVARYED
jgi:phage/plasmid-associated DNA primase